MSVDKPVKDSHNAKPASDAVVRPGPQRRVSAFLDFFVGAVAFAGAIVVPATGSVLLVNFQLLDRFLVRCGLAVLQFPIGMLLYVLPLGLPVIATALVFRWRKRVTAPPHGILHIQLFVGIIIGLVWLFFRVMAAVRLRIG